MLASKVSGVCLATNSALLVCWEDNSELKLSLQGNIVNNNSLFGLRISEERKTLGLSQAEAGEKCGVSREMWGKYERDKAVMGTEVLSKFAEAGADVVYILTGYKNAKALSRDEEILLNNYRHSSDKNKDILKATSDAFAEYSVKSDIA